MHHYIPLATALACGASIIVGVWQLACAKIEIKDEINSVKVTVANLAGQIQQMNDKKTALNQSNR